MKADDDLTVSHRDRADARTDRQGVRKGADGYLDTIKGPPKDGSPAANAEWWKGLSEQEKSDYASLRPAAVGALDGLPAEVRDEANRTVLAEKRGQVEMRLSAIPPEPKKESPGPGTLPTQAWQEWNDKYGDERNRLNKIKSGMEAIQGRFDRTGEYGLPEAYLLGFDPEGERDGKVILANGNPDTADHTAVSVPGTGTNIGGTGGGLEKNDVLWRETQRMTSDEVSTISWFDYNAPDDIPEATSGSYAIDGRENLQGFLEGTETAQGGPGSSHTTVIGHSYGTTLVGETAKHSDFPADDIVAAGSPGMQVKHASELGVGSDHVWAMGANWTLDDGLVRHGGALMGLGDYGTIPTDEEFGGTIMDYGDYRGPMGHSGFWDEDSAALWNQAAVTTGNYDEVKLED